MKLRPCPHCGKPEPRVVMVGYGPARAAEVECTYCGASAPRSVWNDRYNDNATISHQPNPPSLLRLMHESERST